jgi:hypothetical protein
MQEQSKISVRVDQTLIKQFARRIYDNMKAYLQADREQKEWTKCVHNNFTAIKRTLYLLEFI